MWVNVKRKYPGKLAEYSVQFNTVGQAQRFVTAYAAVANLFNLGRHLVRAEHYRNLRMSALTEWKAAVI